MKKRSLSKRFDLNKTTIANLTDFEKDRVLAGVDERCEQYYCYASGSAVWKSSTQYFVNTTASPLPADPRLWPCYVEPPTV